MTTARDRREQIARLVEELQRVSVADLTARFGVTEASIRRDLIGSRTAFAALGSRHDPPSRWPWIL